jgi:NCS1 family nucleobase:cation symporter-1
VVPVVPGFLNAAVTPGGIVANPTFLDSLYTYGLFFTFTVAALSYLAMTKIGGGAPEAAEEREAVPE